jgi:hypothetical protein
LRFTARRPHLRVVISRLSPRYVFGRAARIQREREAVTADESRKLEQESQSPVFGRRTRLVAVSAQWQLRLTSCMKLTLLGSKRGVELQLNTGSRKHVLALSDECAHRTAAVKSMRQIEYYNR